MLRTVLGIVHEGRIELLEDVQLPDGARALVTVLPNEETDFWVQASQVSLDSIWDNAEDDVYAELLKE
ncbi:MAG: hypothetical protein FJ279_13315 [Planctomycetes bacterium]|nr:hypothetical protein [Planctomycetota bacterium]MBM4079905.1 hypothetical protein [Planctomycetota bacterium]